MTAWSSTWSPSPPRGRGGRNAMLRGFRRYDVGWRLRRPRKPACSKHLILERGVLYRELCRQLDRVLEIRPNRSRSRQGLRDRSRQRSHIRSRKASSSAHSRAFVHQPEGLIIARNIISLIASTDCHEEAQEAQRSGCTVAWDVAQLVDRTPYHASLLSPLCAFSCLFVAMKSVVPAAAPRPSG